MSGSATESRIILLAKICVSYPFVSPVLSIFPRMCSLFASCESAHYVELSGCQSVSEVQHAIRQHAEDNPALPWVVREVLSL